MAVERWLDQRFRAAGDGLPTDLYRRLVQEVERPLLLRVMRATRGNQLRAAELLGLNRNTLRKKLREHGLHQSELEG